MIYDGQTDYCGRQTKAILLYRGTNFIPDDGEIIVREINGTILKLLSIRKLI